MRVNVLCIEDDTQESRLVGTIRTAAGGTGCIEAPIDPGTFAGQVVQHLLGGMEKGESR